MLYMLLIISYVTSLSNFFNVAMRSLTNTTNNISISIFHHQFLNKFIICL